MNEISREVVGEVEVWERSEATHYILIFGFQKILSGSCGNQGVFGWGTLGGGVYSILKEHNF